MKIKFSGGSDDIIEYTIDDGRVSDEIYLKSRTESNAGIDIMTFVVSSVGGVRGCLVHAIYDECWSFAPGFLEEGKRFPEGWTFEVGCEHGYSSNLTITADEPIVIVAQGGD